MVLVGDLKVGDLSITCALGLGWGLDCLAVRSRGMVLKNVVLGLGLALGWGVALGKGASSGFGIALCLRGRLSEVWETMIWDFSMAASLRLSARFLFFFEALVAGVTEKEAGAGSEAELMLDVALMWLATALRREDLVRSACIA